MKNNTQIRLAKAVMAVRATSVHAWDEFLRALADHLDDVTEECISAPIDTLQERQGRAREIRDLFKALVGAPELAAQLQDKERKDAGRR
jgi:hypothetical protein